MFVKACRVGDLVEGGLEVAAVERTLVLILWPKGAMPRAFQGFCPHAREPLADAPFDGRTLVCPHHDWVFGGRSGECLDGKTWPAGGISVEGGGRGCAGRCRGA